MTQSADMASLWNTSGFTDFNDTTLRPPNSTEFICDIFCQKLREFEALVRIVVPIFFGLIFVIGVIGNLLVIIVVVSNKQMRNTTNLLIINLALADLLFIIICVPFTAAMYTIPTWPFGLAFCKIYQYMLNVAAYASVYTLVCMSLDRYLAVVHPLRSMTIRTESNAYIVIGLLWVVILGGNVPMILDHGIIEYQNGDEQRSACLHLQYGRFKAKVYYASFFAFAYIIPLLLVCILYGVMLNRLLYRVAPGGGTKSSESMRNKKRVTYMIIIVVVIFIICWLPIQVIFLMTQVLDNYPNGIEYVVIKLAATCIAYMNSCVNPFLYAFLSENFRKSFYKLLCGNKRLRTVRLEVERTNARGLEPLTRTTAANGKNGITIEERIPNNCEVAE